MYTSRSNVYGKTSGSTFFSFLELGELFEKEGFGAKTLDEDSGEWYNYADGNIDNLLDPFQGWRLPTSAEWGLIINGERNGSIVNNVNGARWAYVQLTGISHLGNNSPKGIIVFPDNENITGKNLVAVNKSYEIQIIINEEEEEEEQYTYFCTSGVTENELNAYLAQGCVFLPLSGCYVIADGIWDDYFATYLFSEEYNGPESMCFSFSDNNVDTCYSSSKEDCCLVVRLVKPVN